MKQTAIEWLISEYFGGIENCTPDFRNKIEKAKEMHKQQIIEARQDGHESTYAEYGETPKCYLDGGHEQYYNETFKNK